MVEEMDWKVYVVRCADGTLYTGITREIVRRIDEHNSSDALGARYTRTRRPVALVYQEAVESRSMASRRERTIKRLTKSQKEQLIANAWDLPL